jgi:hypothetical protein
MIDFDKPVRVFLDDTIGYAAVEILRANLPAPLIAVGLIYMPRRDGKKGVEPCVYCFDEKGYAPEAGASIENYEPEPGAFVPRSLRVNEPSICFKTAGGHNATFLRANGVDLDWEITYGRNTEHTLGQTGYITTDDKGRVVEPRPQNASELDIVEVAPDRVRYVRIYDKPKTAKNPSCCTNWYEFDSLEEARANLQGVRAIATVEYREGQNLS